MAAETVHMTWRVKVLPRLEADTEQRLREEAELEAIRVFGRNLHDLLLAAPAGQRVTMGLDPGIRTGVKVAVVDGTGRVLETATVYPHEPRKDWDGSLRTLGILVTKHGVELIAIGNGTASRETDKLVADLQKARPELASPGSWCRRQAPRLLASGWRPRSFPISTCRSVVRCPSPRLQDPLAELVRIDPKAIGVGQYSPM
jgi:uncharacterized protein